MIHERIRNRAKDYPIRDMVPVAYDVLKAREVLREGVSALLRTIPIQACKFCPEVYIGDTGHLIRTCHGYQRRTKDQVHRWAVGKLNDVLVPVEVFHLQHMFQNVIKHDQRFDFDRVPAVLELCCQAGAMVPEEILHGSSSSHSQSPGQDEVGMTPEELRSIPEELKSIAQTTLEAWERLRLGVKKLLLVYPAKVCKYCSEVHIGPSGHKARLCGVFKFEGWRGTHFWKKAEVDDLVPPKVVWHRRPQDPQVLLDSGRGFYGHAPAVVELCAQAGANLPFLYDESEWLAATLKKRWQLVKRHPDWCKVVVMIHFEDATCICIHCSGDAALMPSSTSVILSEANMKAGFCTLLMDGGEILGGFGYICKSGLLELAKETIRFPSALIYLEKYYVILAFSSLLNIYKLLLKIYAGSVIFVLKCF
ncbi:hypothetical protein ACLOJK_037699 [Asimina triloba]